MLSSALLFQDLQVFTVYSLFSSVLPNLQEIVKTLRLIAPILTGLGGVGTLVLAYLYLQQQGELRKQTELQEKLIEASHQPVLEFLEYDPIYGGFLSVHLRNVGNGIATDLEGQIHVYLPDDDQEYSTYSKQLGLIAEAEIEDLNPSVLSEISTLSPGERDKFATEIYGPALSEEGEFRGIPSEFFGNNRSEIVFQVEISFDHIMRTKGRGRKYLCPRINQIPDGASEEGISVSTLISDSDRVNHERFETDTFLPPGTYYDEVEE